MSEPARSHGCGRRFFLESQITGRDGSLELGLSGSDLHHLTAVLRVSGAECVALVVGPEGGLAGRPRV